MRIAFFDPAAEELTPQRKGRLFENLTRRLVALCGFEQIQLRVKHSSLEYDIEARQRLHGHKLIGEAKAHEASISGEVAASFVGKLLPLAATERVDGLLISTSPFTADARDYLDSLQASSLQTLSLSLQTLVGDEIPRFLANAGESIEESVLRSRVSSVYNLEPLDVWLVVSDRTDFLVVSLGPSAVSAPTHFAVFNSDGSELALSDDELQRLRRQHVDLEPLALATPTSPQSPQQVAHLPTVTAGVGWFDYKFPTPPDCFVGREDAISDVSHVIDSIRAGTTAIRSVQVLSKSGVGKSSFLLKLVAESGGNMNLTIDGRNLRVNGDARVLVAQLIQQANNHFGSRVKLPHSLDDVDVALRELATILNQHDRVATVAIDQFESVLSAPAVFGTVLDLIAGCTTRQYPIVWVLARKNDVAATYDESAAIDLSRLNELSHPVAWQGPTLVGGEVIHWTSWAPNSGLR